MNTLIPFSDTRPMPVAGDAIFCMPNGELLNLIRTLAEVSKLAVEIDCCVRLGMMPTEQMTRAMGTLSMALHKRLCTMPLAAMRMPPYPQPTPETARKL